MSLFHEIDIFPLFCLFSSKILSAITAYYIYSLCRIIWAPSVTCLNLIFKNKFHFRNLRPQFPQNLPLFIPVSVAARYRRKLASWKDNSVFLRCTSLYSSKLCSIAEPVPENRIFCDLLGSEALCAAHCKLYGYAGGYCDDIKVCRCRE